MYRAMVGFNGKLPNGYSPPFLLKNAHYSLAVTLAPGRIGTFAYWPRQKSERTWMLAVSSMVP